MAGKFVLLDDDEPPVSAPAAAAPPSGKFVLLDDEPEGPDPVEMTSQSGAFDPRQPPGGPAPGPTPGETALEGMSDWERFKAGGGKVFSDTAHGLLQLGADAGNFLSDDLIPYQVTEDLREETDETNKRDAPLMADPSGRAGNLTANVALGVGLPARTIPTAIASAAAYGAAQPVGTQDSRTENTLAGAGAGMLGASVGGILGRSLSPVRNATAPGTQALIREAEEEGYRFSAGQATGNKHVQNAEGAIETLPMGGSHLAAMDEHNQLLTNRKVGREMGEDVAHVTPEVIESARLRIGAVMDDPSHGRPFDVDHQFFDDIHRLRAQYGTTLKGDQSAQIRSVLDELAAGSSTRNPQITAQQYKDTASKYKTEAEAAFREGKGVGDAKVKRDIAEALDDLAARNLTGNELEAFREARRQYSATLIAEEAVRNDGSGNVRIEALDAATKKHRRIEHRQGTEDELVKLARIGQHLKKVRVPNSGSAERSWWLKAAQSPLTLGAGGASLGYAASGGDPYTTGAGVLLPLALGRGMYSNFGQNWLRNGLPIPRALGGQVTRNHLIGALSRTAPGAASGAIASER
jgi:hypothetical protein